MKHNLRFAALFLSLCLCLPLAARTIRFAGNENNDLYRLLVREGIEATLHSDAAQAIEAAAKSDGVIITAAGYPETAVAVDDAMLAAAKKKNLKVYVEFVDRYPGVEINDTVFTGRLERGVVSSSFFAPELKKMDLLSLNDCRLYRADVKNPLISFARVAGFDVAQYGLSDTDVYPLLWKDGNNLVAFTCLSNFETARYSPVASWKAVWTKILAWLTGDKKLALAHWQSDPHPAYAAGDVLPADARREAVRRGTEWLYKGRFLIHPTWMDYVREMQGDGLNPAGPAVSREALVGDGSQGVLEGHMSAIHNDGTEQYRYWLRADVQGEASFLLASAANLLDDKRYADAAERVLDYLFYVSNFREGEKQKPGSPAYGLIGWAETHPYVFYNDDNARCVLGAIGASARLGNERWNKHIVECILANLRLSSRQGFIPDRIEEPDLLKNGTEFYSDRDFTLPHPHFDSWMWACYLWLYDKTGYRPLLDKAESAIRITMEAYPDKWHWTNGIQQERARMILPLAWLVRVDDTPEHRQWLDTVAGKLLENQAECGGIREELGGEGLGLFDKAKSNKEYGLTEAPLIGENGDPVADMLYTTNFAFFALNEAAHATGDKKYKEAVDRLSDFLVRIQVKSDRHPDLDGAWMRAFDYDRWDYYASNADSGWGAWCTLSGWIQSWIVATQAMVERNESYWDATGKISIDPALMPKD